MLSMTHSYNKGDGHLKVQFIFEILHAPQFWIFAPKFKIEVHAKILNYQLYLEVSSPFSSSTDSVSKLMGVSKYSAHWI